MTVSSFSRLGDARVPYGQAFGAAVTLLDASGAAMDLSARPLSLVAFKVGSIGDPEYQVPLVAAGAAAPAIGSLTAAQISALYATQAGGADLGWGIAETSDGTNWLHQRALRIDPAPTLGTVDAGDNGSAPAVALTLTDVGTVLKIEVVGLPGSAAWIGLAQTINPATGLPYIAAPTVAAMWAALKGGNLVTAGSLSSVVAASLAIPTNTAVFEASPTPFALATMGTTQGSNASADLRQSSIQFNVSTDTTTTAASQIPALYASDLRDGTIISPVGQRLECVIKTQRPNSRLRGLLLISAAQVVDYTGASGNAAITLAFSGDALEDATLDNFGRGVTVNAPHQRVSRVNILGAYKPIRVTSDPITAIPPPFVLLEDIYADGQGSGVVNTDHGSYSGNEVGGQLGSYSRLRGIVTVRMNEHGGYYSNNWNLTYTLHPGQNAGRTIITGQTGNQAFLNGSYSFASDDRPVTITAEGCRYKLAHHCGLKTRHHVGDERYGTIVEDAGYTANNVPGFDAFRDEGLTGGIAIGDKCSGLITGSCGYYGTVLKGCNGGRRYEGGDLADNNVGLFFQSMLYKSYPATIRVDRPYQPVADVSITGYKLRNVKEAIARFDHAMLARTADGTAWADASGNPTTAALANVCFGIGNLYVELDVLSAAAGCVGIDFSAGSRAGGVSNGGNDDDDIDSSNIWGGIGKIQSGCTVEFVGRYPQGVIQTWPTDPKIVLTRWGPRNDWGSLASADTLDLANAGFLGAHVSGTTRITNLGPGPLNGTRTLILDNKCTVQNSAKISLPNAANWVPTMGGTALTFQCLGADVWQCVNVGVATGGPLTFGAYS